MSHNIKFTKLSTSLDTLEKKELSEEVNTKLPTDLQNDLHRPHPHTINTIPR